jgi:hypothetical protein
MDDPTLAPPGTLKLYKVTKTVVSYVVAREPYLARREARHDHEGAIDCVEASGEPEQGWSEWVALGETDRTVGQWLNGEGDA